MGGKLGAHVLNQFIFTHLPQLLNHFNIIHQTGTSSLTMDREKSLALLDSLGSLSDSYLPLGYISEAQIGKYFKNASLYLGRSGGHICYELLLLRLKAVLVPLTTTHAQEQLQNAQILVDYDQAVIIDQFALSLSSFMTATSKLGRMHPRDHNLALNATESIYHDIFTV